MNKKANIALTMGDPAGIGPELAVRAASDSEIAKFANIHIYGSSDIIHEAFTKFIAPHNIFQKNDLTIIETGDIKFSDIPIGRADATCGVEAKNSVKAAALDTISGKMDAIVTTPMNKASVNLAGISFTGHTEFIAELCHCKSFAMMQSAGNLRVAFVTTHIPLNEVSATITEERIIEVTNLLNDVIKREGIVNPKIAAAAINPHAGEDGYMGDEDETVVKPALEKLRNSQINIDGPFPPDTLFISEIRKKYDGILSMYHDQGHIPFKMLAFDTGVNSTLGLPIIRTSVDHGTAFNIAWQGIANTGSLFAAIKLAAIRSRG
jgi:4-hydroxythreonine-4-phosphate dehydrogenase